MSGSFVDKLVSRGQVVPVAPAPVAAPVPETDNVVSLPVPEVAPAAPGEKLPYQAFETYQVKQKVGNEMLTLFYGWDASGYQPYSEIALSHLVEAYGEGPDLLTLIFLHTAITLEGRNLEGLRKALHDRKIEAVHTYDAERHLPVADNAPVITKMERIGKKR